MRFTSVVGLLLLGTATAQKVLVPKPSGAYNVDIRTSQITDFSLKDAQDPHHGPRKLMVSLFSPTKRDTRACESRYMPDTTAAYYSEKVKQYNVTADFSRYVLQACSVDVSKGLPPSGLHERTDSSNGATPKPFPLVFLSGGYGNCRLLYNSMAQFLSSHGYLVLTLDHPYTSDFIQYADGSTVAYNKSLPEDLPHLEPLFEPIVTDSRFILDQLTHNKTFATLLFSAEAFPKSLTRVGYLGHSFGGAAAAQSVHEDKRFVGGIDLDGSLLGDVISTGVSVPFILWQSDRGESRQNHDWSSFWNASTGFKRNLDLKGSSHGTFSDYIILAKVYPWDYIAAGFGPIDGLRSMQIIASYAADFFNFVLNGGSPGLVAGPNKDYPEVEFIP